jgi:hypothetical protein
MKIILPSSKPPYSIPQPYGLYFGTLLTEDPIQQRPRAGRAEPGYAVSDRLQCGVPLRSSSFLGTPVGPDHLSIFLSCAHSLPFYHATVLQLIAAGNGPFPEGKASRHPEGLFWYFGAGTVRY